MDNEKEIQAIQEEIKVKEAKIKELRSDIKLLKKDIENLENKNKVEKFEPSVFNHCNRKRYPSKLGKCPRLGLRRFDGHGSKNQHFLFSSF